MKRYRRALFGLLATTMIVAPTGTDPWTILYRHQFQAHPGQRDMPTVIGTIATHEGYIVVANDEGVWRWQLGQTWERMEARRAMMPGPNPMPHASYFPGALEAVQQICPRSILPTLGPTSPVAGRA